MDKRKKLADIFADTQKYYRENKDLAASVSKSVDSTKLYEPDDYPEIEADSYHECIVIIIKTVKMYSF